MAEYIERNKLIEDIDVAMNNTGMGRVVGETMKRYIKRIPAADVVEVVRCKDCVRRNQSADLSDSVLCTWLHNLSMPKDGYCSYGERKED